MPRDEQADAAMAGVGFVGGELAVDFVNTVGNRLVPEEANDHLPSAAALARWASAAGFAGGRALSGLSPAAFEEAIEFREALHGVLGAVADGEEPSRDALSAVNRVVARARGNRRLARVAGGFAWEWAPSASALDRLLGGIAESAVRVMTGESGGRLRRCSDEKCGWLFLDRSQGGRRRWCSMADCGNRAKARRHYARALQAGK